MLQTTLVGKVDVPALLDAARFGDSRRVERLIVPLDLSDQDLLNGRWFMVQGDDVLTRLVGVQALASHCRSRGDVRLAAEIALNLLDTFAKLGWFELESVEPRTLAIGNVLDLCSNCLTDGGCVAVLLANAELWSAWLDRLAFRDQWRSLQRAWVEACFHDGRLELANSILQQISTRFPAMESSSVERRLLDKLDDLLRAVDQPDTPSAGFTGIVGRLLNELNGSAIPPNDTEKLESVDIEAAIPLVGGLLGLTSLPNELEALKSCIDLLPQSAHPLHHTAEILRGLADHLERNAADSLAIADLAARAAKTALIFSFWEQAVSLKWVRATAQRRSGDLVAAAITLGELREWIKQRQERISDPLLRAALSEYLPHLAGVGVEVLFKLGSARIDELFDVIEEAKARILATLVSERYGHIRTTRLAEVRSILASYSRLASYVTFLVDNDRTYAVAVMPDGTLRSAALSVTRTELARAAEAFASLNDGEKGSLINEAGIDPDDPFGTDYSLVLLALAPIAEWLAEVVEVSRTYGVEVLCVAPDGPLFNLPLALLPIKGVPLVDRVALTIIPSVEVLSVCAKNRTIGQRRRALSVTVPRTTEFNSGLYDFETFTVDQRALSKCWETTVLLPEAAAAERLVELDLSDSIVHIGSHGCFDSTDPLNRSGILLSSNGNLPSGRGHDGKEGLLNPRAATRMHLQGAHITLRACVSGRTTQVTSREALGMIWALFQGGASSVLVASWDADVRSAAPLLAEFYRELGATDSAAVAARSAAIRIRNAREVWQHPYHYAVFSTFGYWN